MLRGYNSLHRTHSIPACCRVLPIHATTTRLTKGATFQQTREGSTSLVCQRLLRFVGVFLTPSKGSDSLSRREPALSLSPGGAVGAGTGLGAPCAAGTASRGLRGSAPRGSRGKATEGRARRPSGAGAEVFKRHAGAALGDVV